MPTFDVSYGPDPVNWDFSGVEGFGPDEKGTIPEPSDAQIRKFARTIREISEGKNLPSVDAPAQWVIAGHVLEEAYTRQTDDGDVIDRDAVEALLDEHAENIADAVSVLCSKSPTAEQYMRLPSALKATFWQYVVQNFYYPELRGAGSKLPTRPGAESGTSSVETSDTE